VTLQDNLLGPAHDERTGMGVLWLPGERMIRGKAVDIDAMCDELEIRFEKHNPRYRPRPLGRHPRFSRYY
jgi:hypothetical protein